MAPPAKTKIAIAAPQKSTSQSFFEADKTFPHLAPARRELARVGMISTPYLEILLSLEYNVARTVARKGGGKPADRKSDCPGVSTCLRG
jgi:hypothetical protein